MSRDDLKKIIAIGYFTVMVTTLGLAYIGYPFPFYLYLICWLCVHDYDLDIIKDKGENL